MTGVENGDWFYRPAMSSNYDNPMSQTDGQTRNLDLSANNLSVSSLSTPPGSGPVRKTRVALACKRCKRRKQRVQLPVIDPRRVGVPLNCILLITFCSVTARVPCANPAREPRRLVATKRLSGPNTLEGNLCKLAHFQSALWRSAYIGVRYINALEERVAFLEARLPAYAEDHFATTSSRTPTLDSNSNGMSHFRPRLDSSSSHRGSVSEDVEDKDHNSIVDGVAYLSLCASGTTDTAPEPFYLGSSSGAAIARMIQKSIFRNPGSRAVAQDIRSTHTLQPELSRSHLSTPPFPTPSKEASFEFPFLDQARLLFDVFFDRMHTRWPILDRKAHSVLFERQYDHGALSITQRSIMHLIYAIAARFLQLTRKPSGVDPEQHLLAAIEPMDYILEQHNLATVQFLLLLGVHGQRSPYGAGAWSQVRYAVSLCIELGLHRERRGLPSRHGSREVEIRRRAFWACYCLDRGTSVVLGRAFAIADRDINVLVSLTEGIERKKGGRKKLTITINF